MQLRHELWANFREGAVMNRYVMDTHPLVWHLSSDERLSATAKRLFASASAGSDQVLVPGIVLIEMVYLVEKGVVKREHFEQTVALLATLNGSYQVAPLDQACCPCYAQSGADDSREKRTLGALWSERSAGDCLFVMPKGRDFAAIQAQLGRFRRNCSS